MKSKDIVLITSLLFGAAAWATASYGQTEVEAEAGVDVSAEVEVEENLDGSLNSAFRPGENLLERLGENLDNVPEELESDMVALRETLSQLKSVWESEYRPEEGATDEEIRAAVESFRAEYRSEIDAAIELRRSLVTSVRGDLRQRGEGRGIGRFVSSSRREINAMRNELRVAWRDALDALGTDATREEIDAAKAAFLEENRELIALQKELSLEIRNRVRAEIAAERPEIGRRGPPPAIQELKEEMQAARAGLREVRNEARDELGDLASSEERQEARQEILEELRNAQDDIKERRREVIDKLRGGQGPGRGGPIEGASD